MGGFALLLRYLTWPQAAALALAALIVNAFWLGRFAPQIVRPTDAPGARAGVLFYPLSILVLVVLLPDRLDIVAAAWGVMACGDGLATLAGQRQRGQSLPWHPRKTWRGLGAFVVAGAAGATALSAWVAPSITPRPSLTFTLLAPGLAALVAAFVETLPIELDDNVTVPLSAAGVLWFLSQLGRPEPVGTLLFDLALGSIISLPVASMAKKRGQLTAGGALIGLVFAGVIYAGLYLAGLVVLATALGLTLVSTRIGDRRRAARGMTERHERRQAGNIIANCLVGTMGAALELSGSEWGLELAGVWCVAGIAAGASDTVASEIGQALGRVPRSVSTWQPVRPGTPGAVSAVGTVAGVIAALLIALPAALMWLVPWSAVLVIAAACTVAALVESALASSLERARILDNNTLNFLNTAVAAALAVSFSDWANP